MRDTHLNDQTILLSFLLFVAAPLQANGLITPPLWGLLFGLVLIPGVFMVSGSKFAVGLILLAIALVVVAAVAGSRRPSNFDKLLDDIAWLIAGFTLATVVARAVFAPGRVTIASLVERFSISSSD
jgi:hypothetical protein